MHINSWGNIFNLLKYFDYIVQFACILYIKYLVIKHALSNVIENVIEIKIYQFDIIINPSNLSSSSFFHISHPSEKLDEKKAFAVDLACIKPGTRTPYCKFQYAVGITLNILKRSANVVQTRPDTNKALHLREDGLEYQI